MKTQIQNAQIWRRNLLGTLLALGCLPSGAYGQLSGGFGTTSGTLPGVAPPGSTQSEPIPGSGGLIGGPNTGASSPGFGSPSSEVGSAGSAPGGMAPGGMMGGGMGVPGGGMGGMGGSMFGTGGIGSIGSMGHMGTYSPPPTPLVIWEKPTGEKPQWLVSGHNALQATEAVRRSLEIANECAFSNVPLQQAIEELLDTAKVPYSINTQELELLGHSPDVPVSFSGKGPTRELLRRLLSPLDLGYIVREDYVEINSIDMVNQVPVLRTYDLAHVMSSNQGLDQLLTCIQTTIEPDVWDDGAANMSPLGSLLVVRAPENVQHEISKLLVIRSQHPQAAGQSGRLSSNGESFSPNSGAITYGSGLPAPVNSNPGSTSDSSGPGGLPATRGASSLGGEARKSEAASPPGGEATRGGGSNDY